MAWGGATISTNLGLDGWAGAHVAVFALGIVAVASAPVARLSARVRSLEAQLAEKMQLRE